MITMNKNFTFILYLHTQFSSIHLHTIFTYLTSVESGSSSVGIEPGALIPRGRRTCRLRHLVPDWQKINEWTWTGESSLHCKWIKLNITAITSVHFISIAISVDPRLLIPCCLSISSFLHSSEPGTRDSTWANQQLAVWRSKGAKIRKRGKQGTTRSVLAGSSSAAQSHNVNSYSFHCCSERHLRSKS
jgi:hypothetical protein